MIILIPPRTSQPELGALSALHSHSLIKTQSQATNSNKPSTSSLKEGRVGWWGVQITVGLSASASVRDTWNRNPASNHFLCKKGYLKKIIGFGDFFFLYPQWERSLFNKDYKDYGVPSGIWLACTSIVFDCLREVTWCTLFKSLFSWSCPKLKSSQTLPGIDAAAHNPFWLPYPPFHSLSLFFSLCDKHTCTNTHSRQGFKPSLIISSSEYINLCSLALIQTWCSEVGHFCQLLNSFSI